MGFYWPAYGNCAGLLIVFSYLINEEACIVVNYGMGLFVAGFMANSIGSPAISYFKGQVRNMRPSVAYFKGQVRNMRAKVVYFTGQLRNMRSKVAYFLYKVFNFEP